MNRQRTRKLEELTAFCLLVYAPASQVNIDSCHAIEEPGKQTKTLESFYSPSVKEYYGDYFNNNSVMKHVQTAQTMAQHPALPRQ